MADTRIIIVFQTWFAVSFRLRNFITRVRMLRNFELFFTWLLFFAPHKLNVYFLQFLSNYQSCGSNLSLHSRINMLSKIVFFFSFHLLTEARVGYSIFHHLLELLWNSHCFGFYTFDHKNNNAMAYKTLGQFPFLPLYNPAKATRPTMCEYVIDKI